MARMDPELVKYVEKHLSKGVELKQIKRTLADVGHPIDAIEDAAAFVTNKQPELKQAPRKMMIVYGLILILVLAGFGWYIWFKATQQIEYTQTVQQIEQNRSYIGMTDVQLLKLAASDDDMKACRFIKDHNMYYACTGKYWLRDDCSYAQLIGESDACFLKKVKASGEVADCIYIKDDALRASCSEDTFKEVAASGDYSRCKGQVSCLDYAFVLKAGSLDFNFCSNYLGQNARDLCVLNLSITQGESSRCASIADPWIGGNCLIRLAKSPEELFSFCQSLSSDSSRNLSNAQIGSYFVSTSAIGLRKGIYTCEALFGFVAAHKDAAFLSDFEAQFKSFVGALDSSDFNKPVVRCVK